MQSTRLRRPTPGDGVALHNLVQRCPPLDQNSRHCDLLQVSRLRDTAIVAAQQDELCASVSGCRVPGNAHFEDEHDEEILFSIGPFVADGAEPLLRESA